MDTIPARDLRNNVSAVLRRVEAGEHLTVTVSGRAVAQLSPMPGNRRSLSKHRYLEMRRRGRLADPGLLADLRDLAPDMTDDL
jgi:prevent-host-death family protein